MILLKKFIIVLTLTAFVLTLPGCANTQLNNSSGRNVPVSSRYNIQGMACSTQKAEQDEAILKTILIGGAVLVVAAAVVGFIIIPKAAEGLGAAMASHVV